MSAKDFWEKGGKYVSRARVVYCLDGFWRISLLDVTVVLVVFCLGLRTLNCKKKVWEV